MLKIGITGGIGSGKSIVTKVFSILGIPVYDADSRAKYLMAHDDFLKLELIKLFGNECFVNNDLDRKFIANQVFNNSTKLSQLNALVHPAVGRDFENWCRQYLHLPFVVKEAALMFESEAYKQLDKIITVFAPEKIRIQRVLNRDRHRKYEDVKAIIANQFPEDRKIASADYIIYNDDKQLVIPQVLKIVTEFSDLFIVEEQL